MVTTAGFAVDLRLIACHVALSGVQVRAAANSGASSGGSLVSAAQSGSMGPTRRRGPGDCLRIAGRPSAKPISICHRAAPLSSLHKNVGAGNSGGKMEPFSGYTTERDAPLSASAAVRPENRALLTFCWPPGPAATLRAELPPACRPLWSAPELRS